VCARERPHGSVRGVPVTGIPTAITMKAKAFSFTHRTKVFADGTVRKNDA